MTEEQRLEEGRRMFQMFAAKMFEQRVLSAYREKVSLENQKVSEYIIGEKQYFPYLIFPRLLLLVITCFEDIYFIKKLLEEHEREEQEERERKAQKEKKLELKREKKKEQKRLLEEKKEQLRLQREREEREKVLNEKIRILIFLRLNN